MEEIQQIQREINQLENSKGYLADPSIPLDRQSDEHIDKEIENLKMQQKQIAERQLQSLERKLSEINQEIADVEDENKSNIQTSNYYGPGANLTDQSELESYSDNKTSLSDDKYRIEQEISYLKNFLPKKSWWSFGGKKKTRRKKKNSKKRRTKRKRRN